MNATDTEPVHSEDTLALALYAVSYGVEEAKKAAAEQGMKFDKEQVLLATAAYMGEDVAENLRMIWDEAGRSAFQKQVEERIARESSSLWQQSKQQINRVFHTVLRTAKELADAFNPASSPTPMALQSALRSPREGTDETDQQAPPPHIEPTLDLHEDGQTLIIGLDLKSRSNQVMPENKGSVTLEIDGEIVLVFEFTRNDDLSIDLEVTVSEDYAARANTKDCKLRYDYSLQNIDITIGENLKDDELDAIPED
ncbi:MAG: hypothetical protein LBE22_04580 [Azoarcus sp.]|jgi:hypothetical protein|nr:hypothetical protein [Azoarcus sp.]